MLDILLQLLKQFCTRMSDTVWNVILREIIGSEACQSIQTVSMLTSLVLVLMPDIGHLYKAQRILKLNIMERGITYETWTEKCQQITQMLLRLFQESIFFSSRFPLHYSMRKPVKEIFYPYRLHRWSCGALVFPLKMIVNTCFYDLIWKLKCIYLWM